MSYSGKLHKQTAQVEGKMKALGAAMLAASRRQEKLLPELESRREKIARDITSLEHRLKSLMEKDGFEDDPQFVRLKERYVHLILERKEVDTTIQMAEESVAQAKTLYTDGPVDPVVMGPSAPVGSKK